MDLFIRRKRQEKQWTLEFVAKQVGLTISAVSDIEKGRCKPSYEVLVKLENLFKKSHHELFAVVDDTKNK